MPAKDVHHDAVRAALEKAGWTITADPLRLTLGKRAIFIDLAAERLLAAVRGDDRIAVEVKSFLGPSDLRELELALGQYTIYDRILKQVDPGRTLWLAVSREIHEGLLSEAVGDLLLNDATLGLRVLVFDPGGEEVVQWIPTKI